MIHVIDYEVGNILSIKNMLHRCGVKAVVTSEIDELLNAKKIILPGVGAFGYAMDRLRHYNLIDLLNHKAQQEKIPILGICLGAQLLFSSSEEGNCDGLGWVTGEVIKFRKEKAKENLKIPNMGWMDVVPLKTSNLLEELPEDPRYYFVHSYHFLCANEEDALLKANHGYDFTAAVEKGNILGVQFHPEKSHKYGMKLLSNFAKNY